MFKVGDKVVCAKFKGVGEVVEIVETVDAYPVKVMYRFPNFSKFSFTLDGRYYADSYVSLFHVKAEPVVEKVTVNIEVKTTRSFEITQAEFHVIHDLVGDSDSAVEFIKAQYGIPRTEAKLICSKVWETPQ